MRIREHHIAVALMILAAVIAVGGLLYLGFVNSTAGNVP